MPERERSEPAAPDIDEKKAREEGASPQELQDINESQGDGGNPEWWKNEGRQPGEVH